MNRLSCLIHPTHYPRLAYAPASHIAPAASQSTLHAEGKALRAELPHGQHAEPGLPAGRDPLAIIDATHVGRVPELIGVRTYCMSQLAFAYYCATADVMAADLASGPRTSIHLVICGDAHISNFGLYASPERRLLFDLSTTSTKPPKARGNGTSSACV